MTRKVAQALYYIVVIGLALLFIYLATTHLTQGYPVRA